MKPRWMVFLLLVLAALAASACGGADRPEAPFEFDHVWIVVSSGAPERALLEKAGLTAGEAVHRHDGQGTASMTFEFLNGYLELLWPDAGVPISPEFERGARKFQQRMEWRTSGWSPLGIGLRRTGREADALPFPTWTIAPPWLNPGEAIVMLHPRDDTSSPSLFITPHAVEETDRRAASLPDHALGVRRVTGLHLVAPEAYRPIEPLLYLVDQGVLSLESGEAWRLDLTFDGGRRGEERDLRPDLPLRLRY